MAAEEVKESANGVIEVELPELTRPLEKMTVKELREIGLKVPTMVGVHSMKKDELVTRLREVYGIQDEQRVADDSIRALKARIRKLKVEKAQARAAADRHKVDICRRKISRLKKQTRKMARAAATAAA